MYLKNSEMFNKFLKLICFYKNTLYICHYYSCVYMEITMKYRVNTDLDSVCNLKMEVMKF